MALREMWSKLVCGLFCTAVALAAAPTPAQPTTPTAPYPQASAGSAAASAGLAARKDWIVRHAACGREDHYVQLLAAERGGSFRESQGEGFINLLGAKVAFLRDHPGKPCLAQVLQKRPHRGRTAM